MRIRLSTSFCLVPAMLGLNGLVTCCAQTAENDPGRQPAIAARAVAEETTNSLQLQSKKEGRKRLEQDLNRSSYAFSPKSQLDSMMETPVYSAPPQSMMQSKRARELSERQKDWVFMTPNDPAAAPTTAELFGVPEYGPDGREKKQLSPVERFYEDLRRRQAGEFKGELLKDKEPFGRRRGVGMGDDRGSHDQADSPNGGRESDKALRNQREASSSSGGPAAAPTRGFFLDVFGLGGPTLSREDIKAHEEYVKRFQEILNGPPPAPRSEPFNPMGGANESVRTTLNPAAGLPGASGRGRSDGYDPQLGGISPTYVPSASVDMNARLLNQWNPAYVPPKVEQPTLTPPTPTFTPPRRAF